MGYNCEMFVDEAAKTPHVKCIICTDVMRDPMACGLCGYAACRVCFETSAAGGDHRCMFCRKLSPLTAPRSQIPSCATSFIIFFFIFHTDSSKWCVFRMLLSGPSKQRVREQVSISLMESEELLHRTIPNNQILNTNYQAAGSGAGASPAQHHRRSRGEMRISRLQMDGPSIRARGALRNVESGLVFRRHCLLNGVLG